MTGTESPVQADGPVRRLRPVPALDGLRGVAVLMVLVYHTQFLITGPLGIQALDNLIDGGHVGVDLFFVLSGFLITALLLREQSEHGEVGFGSFYIRRGLRLLPALVVLLVAYFIYAKVTHLGPTAFTSIKWAVVYSSNWLAAWHIRSVDISMAHLWSLAIEEQFYLLWPAVLILFLSLKRSATFVTAVMVTGIVLIALHRALLWTPGDVSSNVSLYFRTDTRLDALLIGALLASLWVRGYTPTRGLVPAAWIAAVTFIVSAEFARSDYDFIYLGGFDLIAISCAVLILAAIDGRWPGNRILEIPPLRLVGRVSYGLYLWHVPIFVAVSRYGTHELKVVRVLEAWGLTAIFTAASWLLVERPALGLKHRLERKRTASISEPAA